MVPQRSGPTRKRTWLIVLRIRRCYAAVTWQPRRMARRGEGVLNFHLHRSCLTGWKFKLQFLTYTCRNSTKTALSYKMDVQFMTSMSNMLQFWRKFFDFWTYPGKKGRPKREISTPLPSLRHSAGLPHNWCVTPAYLECKVSHAPFLMDLNARPPATWRPRKQRGRNTQAPSIPPPYTMVLSYE